MKEILENQRGPKVQCCSDPQGRQHDRELNVYILTALQPMEYLEET